MFVCEELLLCFQIKCVVEVRDYDHGVQLEEALISHYGKVIWGSEAVYRDI